MKEAKNLPVMRPKELLEHVGKSRDAGKDPGKILVELQDFIAMLEGVGGFELTPKILLSLSSPRIKLTLPPVKVGEKSCYVFPDQFNEVGMILTLRQAYNLPLATIRTLLECFPRENFELIMERKFEISDLLDLAKMLKAGYRLSDLVMAKACDILLLDLMSSSTALEAAIEPGDTLRRLQEKLLSVRLDELKAWISSGRRQEFLRRESAQDLEDLASKRLVHKRIVNKVLTRKARAAGRK